MNSSANPLDSLERRVEQLLGQFENLRLENQGLRHKLLETQSERDDLQARIETAAERLEMLKDKLPAE